MNILVLGDANSIWTKRVIEEIMVSPDNTVKLVTSTNSAFAENYTELGINVVSTVNDKSIFFRFRLIRKLRQISLLIYNYLFGKYDITHVQFGFYSTLKMISILPKPRSLIITYWGSDLLRIPTNKLMKVTKAIEKADYITVGSEVLMTKVVSVYKDIVTSKSEIVRMGLSNLSTIEKLLPSRKAVRREVLGKYSDRIAIMIGYNAAPNQQHIEVLKAINNIDSNLKDRMVLILPLTYLRNDTVYIEQIKKEIKEIDLESIVLEKFLSEVEMAKLSIVTDVFINAQTTDAISGTMLELLYSGTRVINGNWLSYSFLEKNKIRCEVFNTFDEIVHLLEEYINEDGFVVENTDLIKKEFSWEEVKKKWENIYRRVIQNT